MARYHYWQFIVNQEGQPIKNVDVSVYEAGTDTPAYVYTSESGSDVNNDVPQITTNNSGYFEFWLGDTQESNGYPIGQKFKIRWDKENITSGSVDWVDIFPGFEPVDETDEESTYKNKLVNNKLAYDWSSHITHQDVTSTSTPTFNQIFVTSDPEDDENVTSKKFVLDLKNQDSWQNSILMFQNPNETLMSENTGDRYVATVDSSGGSLDWTENYIYEYDGSDWIEIEPEDGKTLYNEDDSSFYTFDGSQWEKTENLFNHNTLSGLDGGGTTYFYHLTQNAWDNLKLQDQRVYTTSSPSFKNVIITEEPDELDNAITINYFKNETIENPWQKEVINFIDVSSETPSAYEGVRYISSNTVSSSGWIEDYIYEHDGEDWIELEPRQGFSLYITELDQRYIYDDIRGWVESVYLYEEVDETDTSTLKNKLVSNYLANKWNLFADQSIYTYSEQISASEWQSDGSLYSKSVTHDIGDEYVSVTCWDKDTKKVISLNDIESIDENTTKFYTNDNTINVFVKIIG